MKIMDENAALKKQVKELKKELAEAKLNMSYMIDPNAIGNRNDMGWQFWDLVEEGERVKSVLKYPGAKNRLASWICEYIPKHDVYVEPLPYMKGHAFRYATFSRYIIDDIYSNGYIVCHLN